MRRVVIVCACIVLVVCMVSCNDQTNGPSLYGSVSVSVLGKVGAKTIQPSMEELEFSYFRIEGEHGGEKTVDETFTSRSITIDGLVVGIWKFSVTGYNKDGLPLAKSSVHDVEIKSNGISKETYLLDWVEGLGSLKLSINVQTSQVSSIECNLIDSSGNEIQYEMEKVDSKVGSDGLYLFSKSFTDVHSGFYDGEVVMKKADGSVVGVAVHPSIHIFSGLTSKYEFSWKDFKDLLPNVDKPVLSNIADGATSIRCDSTISLGVSEEGARILYSVDGGTSYSQYEGDRGIALSGIEGLSERLELSFYAEKDGMNQSDVETKVYDVVHSPDRGNASYVWEKVSDGYECVASSKCLIHGSFVCETERASKTTKEVSKEPTCTEYGTDRYTSTFAIEGYEEQVKDFSVSKLLHSYVEVVDNMYLKSEATCTAKAVYYKSCSVCGASSNSSSYTFEHGEALGHDYSSGTYADADCHWISCIRCGAKTGAKELHSFEDYRCTCGLWTKGPTGGYVFYDCDADNDSGNADGLVSSECGWRYLEAAPADLRVVGGVPTVDATVSGYDSAEKGYIFGYYRTSASGDDQLVGTDKAIGTGKSNTEKLVDAMGTSAYTSSRGCGTTAAYAARLCSMLEYGHDGVVYDDWFLPSRDELNLMYQNLKMNGLGSIAGSNYWSSSESNAGLAWVQYFCDGNQDVYYRSRGYRVRPVRAF